MATIEQYYAIVSRWTTPSNVKTVRFGRRDEIPYYIQDPGGRSPEEIDDMIEELRNRMALGPDD
jgi:hypothetical protein